MSEKDETYHLEKEEWQTQIAKRSSRFILANRKLKKEIEQRDKLAHDLKLYEQIVSATREFLSIINKSYVYLAVNRFILIHMK